MSASPDRPWARVAQLVEQRIENPRVGSSILSPGTILTLLRETESAPNGYLVQMTAACPASISDSSGPERWERLFTAFLGQRFSRGNKVEMHVEPDEIFGSMLKAIREAKKSILFLTFWMRDDSLGREFCDALCERAQAGVEVYVLLDWFGSHPAYNGIIQKLEACGANVAVYRPPRITAPGFLANRTHRKLLITDQRHGFVGGVGISDQWGGGDPDEPPRRDAEYHIQGPLVRHLTAGFVESWGDGARQLLPLEIEDADMQERGSCDGLFYRSSGLARWNDIRTAFELLITNAERSIYMTTAYFAPPRDLLECLCVKAKAGVDVQLIIPGRRNDHPITNRAAEAWAGDLLKAGAEIYRYQPSMLHAKTLLIDGEIVCVGSANFNGRSLRLDQELCVVLREADLIERLERQFQTDKANSRYYSLSEWEKRPHWKRVFEPLAKQLFPLI